MWQFHFERKSNKSFVAWKLQGLSLKSQNQSHGVQGWWWCQSKMELFGDGTVWICIDFKVLNESVLREIFPIPKVDDTLAQLADATIFSKIDTNSGFWQIPLTKISHPLTNFITPYMAAIISSSCPLGFHVPQNYSNFE